MWLISAPHALRFDVAFDQIYMVRRATGLPQVTERFLIDGKEAHGGPEFGGHVCNCGAIRQREVIQCRPAELYNSRQYVGASQELRQSQNDVGTHDARLRDSSEAATDDARCQQAHGLIEHRGGCFDAANSPPKYAQCVDHRSVAVHSNQSVRKCNRYGRSGYRT